MATTPCACRKLKSGSAIATEKRKERQTVLSSAVIQNIFLMQNVLIGRSKNRRRLRGK